MQPLSITYGGFRSSRSFGIDHQITLMSPNQGKTAVCGSYVLFLDDWGGDHWLPQRGLCVPLAMASVLLTGSVDKIPSDYYHLSQIPYTGQCVQITICLRRWSHYGRIDGDGNVLECDESSHLSLAT